MDTDEWNKELRNKYYPWMSGDQFECYELLCDLFGGDQHILGKIKPFGLGIEINSRNHGFATYDFNTLTRAVIMAHDRMIRFEISPSGPGMLKLSFFKRHKRDGSMYERHPTIEDAIKDCRPTHQRGE